MAQLQMHYSSRLGSDQSTQNKQKKNLIYNHGLRQQLYMAKQRADCLEKFELKCSALMWCDAMCDNLHTTTSSGIYTHQFQQALMLDMNFIFFL